MKHTHKISLSLIILALAVPITVLALPQKTHIEQNASQVHNINSAIQIEETNNDDGTMGPPTFEGNFSNSLPQNQKGDLTVFLMNTIPSGENGPRGNNNAGPQPVIGLSVTVNKIEVHLSQGPSSDDHWETLNMGNPKVIDLVKLETTGTLEAFGITHLSVGHYTEIRLYVTHVVATRPNGMVVGVEIDDHDGTIAINRPFDIYPGRTTNITLDTDAQHSVIKLNGRYLFKPAIVRFLENK